MESLVLTARYRVLAIGRAGAAAVLPLLSEGLLDVDYAVLDTDPEALAQTSIPNRLNFGEAATFGLGTGSDPARGRAAAEAELDRLRPLVAGARLVFLVAGLGGGTGSGASPVLARLAREVGALTLGVVTLPFDCEGHQRARHAREAVIALRSAADAVICVPKQRVLAQFKDIDKPALTDVLTAANALTGQSISGVIRLLTRPGLLPLDFAHFERLLRGRHAESCFASVEASGPHRTRDVVEQLRRHPFLDRGQALTEAHAVLVSVAAGPDVSFTEIDTIFTHVQNLCERAEVVTGTTLDPVLAERLVVTVIASHVPAPAGPAAVGNSVVAPGISGSTLRPDSGAALGPDLLLPAVASDRTAGPPARAGATLMSPSGSSLPVAAAPIVVGRKKVKPVQSVLNFDPLPNRGRFEGMPATVHQGEDLDVPTYLRQGVALN